jgi:DNA modification methylase
MTKLSKPADDGSNARGTGALMTMTGLARLAPYKRNARIHSKKQIRQIASSIERFGFTNPILIDDNDMILAGHGRAAAARLLGMDMVPTIRLSAMSDADKRAYILADNKIAENAGWDVDILAGELEFILGEAHTIDIGLTGFSIAEVDAAIDGGESSQQQRYDDKEEFIPAPQSEPVTRLGDIWQLGEHRLCCGDAREETCYSRLMTSSRGDPELAQMVFTDPPYNVRIDGNVSGSGRHREFVMASGEMSNASFVTFLTSSFHLAATWSVNGSIHFICMDWRHINELQSAGEQVYSELKNLIVWVKDNAGMGSFYRSRHELIFAFKNGTEPHINAFELGQNGRYRTNVWHYRGATSPTRETRQALALHPTVKPVAMVVDALKDCSRRGGIVLDPFCGSGTIFIAAQKTGRRARAIELDPIHCDTAIRRWQLFANDDAILVETGETFEQLDERRRKTQSQQPSMTPGSGDSHE